MKPGLPSEPVIHAVGHNRNCQLLFVFVFLLNFQLRHFSSQRWRIERIKARKDRVDLSALGQGVPDEFAIRCRLCALSFEIEDQREWSGNRIMTQQDFVFITIDDG